MGKLRINPFLLLRRPYAVAAANVKVQPVAGAMRKAAATAAVKEPLSSANTAAVAAKAKKEETFWMRDPKTGNWVPETHFVGDDQVDVAEQREKLLPNNHKRI
ncbi:hypothetical protein TIFTF001_006281 [Ficus carica]|uniref:Late embryogenesis abundant protein n=1 Tax=Ficus carica TaxID=3494 RepID=A0AA87ZM50_FICCA|nr:hypothetical protein TIFTF001_006281 [Ficus carica]